MLDRRQVLSLVGTGALTGMAGCVSSRGGVSSGIGESSVSFDATVLRSFSDEHPARIRLEFASRTDEPLSYLSQVGRGQPGLFREVWGSHRDSEAELLLLGDGVRCASGTITPVAIPETPIQEPSNADGETHGCWRPPCDDLLLYHVDPAWEEIPADEPETDEYVVLDGMNDECLPSGTYDFSDTGLVARREPTSAGWAGVSSGRYEIERKIAITIGDDLGLEVSTDVAIASS